MKNWRRGMVLLMAALMMMTALPAASLAEMINMDTYSDWVEVKKTPEGKFGKKMTMSLIIKNPNEDEMKDVKISLAPQDEYDEKDDYDEEEDGTRVEDRYQYVFPFEVDSTTFKPKAVGNIAPHKSKGVTLSAKVRRDLKEGYYPVMLYIESNQGTQAVYVNVWLSASTGTSESEESNDDVAFVMGENQDTPYGVYPSVMNFSINLRNSGIKKAYDVRVNMQLDADSAKFPFEISEANYDRNMGDIDSGQTVEIPYSMAIRDKLKSGYYPINFKVKYREDMESDYVEPIDMVYYVRISGNSEDELSADADESQRKKARLIVDSFETDPKEVYAGQPFTLKVRMKNASSDIPASNIVFTFAPEEKDGSPIFSAEDGSNSIAISSMGPGSTAELTMRLVSIPTAEQKFYTMTIKEKYDSPEFKNAGKDDDVKISIQVKQEPRLNTGTIEIMPEAINVGSETNVMFGINNTGKVLLYNVMATFEADSIQKVDAYVGNIEPGKTGNVDTMISGIAPTDDDGKVKIIISYEDENGVVSNVEKEMTLMVMEAPPEDFGDMDVGNMDDLEAEDTSFFSKNKKVIFPVAAVVVIGIVAALIIRKKKKVEKEEEMDDEIS